MMLVCRIWRPLDSFLKKALQPCKAKMLVLAAEAMQMLAVLISKDMYDIKEDYMQLHFFQKRARGSPERKAIADLEFSHLKELVKCYDGPPPKDEPLLDLFFMNVQISVACLHLKGSGEVWETNDIDVSPLGDAHMLMDQTHGRFARVYHSTLMSNPLQSLHSGDLVSYLGQQLHHMSLQLYMRMFDERLLDPPAIQQGAAFLSRQLTFVRTSGNPRESPRNQAIWSRYCFQAGLSGIV